MISRDLRIFEILVIIQQMLDVTTIIFPQLFQNIKFLQTLEELNILSCSIQFLLLVLLYHFDGMRLSILSIVLSDILIFLLRRVTISSSFCQQLLLFILIISTFISTAIYAFFPVLTLPLTTGKYKVGYKALLKNHNQFALFYPTLDKLLCTLDLPYITPKDQLQLYKQDTTDELQYHERLLGTEYFLWFYKTLCKMPRDRMPIVIPYQILKITLHFFTKKNMGVINHAKFAIPSDYTSTAPLIIYSHGISSNMNYSASLCKELASNGFIIASLQHHDEILLQSAQNPHNLISEYISIQHRSVLARRDQVQTIMDELISTNISSILPGAVSPNKCVIIGHSYGGQVAALCALNEDSRILSGILLDPVMNLFDVAEFEHLITQPLKKPLLIVISDHFNSLYPFYSQKPNLNKLINAQKGFSGKNNNNNNLRNLLLSLKMKNTEHCDFIDIGFLTPKELQISRKDIHSPDRVHLNSVLLNKLIEIFLDAIMKSETMQLDGDRILANVQRFCNDNLKIDCPFELIK